MYFLHSAKMILCVSADEVPWPQESPTNFENPHFAIIDTLKVLKIILDIPQSPKSENHKVNILQHTEIDSRLLRRSCTKETMQ